MGRCFSVSQFNVLVTDTISEEGIERLIRDGSIEVDVGPEGVR